MFNPADEAHRTKYDAVDDGSFDLGFVRTSQLRTLDPHERQWDDDYLEAQVRRPKVDDLAKFYHQQLDDWGNLVDDELSFTDIGESPFDSHS